MKLKSCKEFEELQKALKDYTYQSSRAEIKRVQACNDLGEYYTKKLYLASAAYPYSRYLHRDFINTRVYLDFGGEAAAMRHSLKYYFKHLDECPNDIKNEVIALSKDPHLKELYAKKQEALKERRETRKKRDEYRKLNTEWLESSFKRAFGNQAIVNITDYTCTYFATFNGTQIAATSYKGKLDRITVDNFHQTTLNNFMKMPLVDVVTKDNVRDFYEKWLN